jgi:hypothetical protein
VAKIAALNPSGKKWGFSSETSLVYLFFPGFVISELCSVLFMPRRFYFLDVPRKTQCLLCSLWHYTTFRPIHFAAAEFNEALCTGGSWSHRKVTYDVCPSVSVSVSVSPVCLSVYLFISPKTSLFSYRFPEASHIRRMGVRWYFCSGFFRTCDPKRGKRAFGEQPDFTQRSK